MIESDAGYATADDRSGVVTRRVQPVVDDDATIAVALRDVSVPTLAAAVVHMTGDPSLLRGPIRPRTFVPNDFQGGLLDDERATLRQQALAAIRSYRDAGCPAPATPDPAVVLETMSWLVCEDVSSEYVPMFLEEMDVEGRDPRRIELEGITPQAKRNLSALVIGCGVSGLLAGIRLKQAGVPFSIIEKNADVGGSWFENMYPGCRVDVGNHYYCYSFEPNDGFSEFFSQQPELLDYLRSVMERRDVGPAVRWSTEAVSARWDEQAQRWHVLLRGPEGEEDAVEADILISAVGQLNRPFVPDVPGLDSFAGPTFHTARWDADVALSGERVAMIGAGASGFQLAPSIADIVGRLVIFQRSAQWMAPNPKYRQAVGQGVRWAMRHLPGYASWYRFMLLYQSSDKTLELAKIDPDWPKVPESANAVSEERRKILVSWMEQHLADMPDLLEKVMPDYPPMGKRLLQDDGSWLRCLRRDNVELVRDKVLRIEPDAVVTTSGRYEADVLIMATGFRANEMLSPMDVVGRGGVRLADFWGTAPAAHLGITVPGFPNFFMMYGPGTNLAHAGSIIFHSECQMQFIGTCLRAMLERDSRSVEVTPEAFAAYVTKLDEELATTVWAHPSVKHSWYKAPDGKVHVLSPWRLVDYWFMTKYPNLEDYVFS